MRFNAVALVGFAAAASAQVVFPAQPGQMVPPESATEGGEIIPDLPEPAAVAPAPMGPPMPMGPPKGPAPEDMGPGIFQGPFGFPVGVGRPDKKKDMPASGPPKGMNKGKDGLPVWHPPHKGVFIDDCDDEEDDKWHWAHKGKKHPKPMIPHHKWTTSTVTATKTKTVIDCPDKAHDCPGKPKTKYTTTTVEVTTTICPVPITDTPKPPPHPPMPTKPAPMPPSPPAPGPTKEAPPASYPPKPTSPATSPEMPEYSKPPTVVTAGAAQNAAGALAAVAAFIVALV